MSRCHFLRRRLSLRFTNGLIITPTYIQYCFHQSSSSPSPSSILLRHINGECHTCRHGHSRFTLAYRLSATNAIFTAITLLLPYEYHCYHTPFHCRHYSAAGVYGDSRDRRRLSEDVTTAEMDAEYRFSSPLSLFSTRRIHILYSSRWESPPLLIC